MRTSYLICAAMAAISFSAVSPAQAHNSLQLKDGRFVMGKKMTKLDAGVTIHFKNGDVLIKDAMIKNTSARTAGGGDEELSAEAKKNLAKGLVLYKGKWKKKSYVDRVTAKEIKARQDKIEEARSHRKWKQHYTMRTKNFKFEYTIDPEVMRGYADLMEVYYKNFMREWAEVIPLPGRLGGDFARGDHAIDRAGFSLVRLFSIIIEKLNLHAHARRTAVM